MKIKKKNNKKIANSSWIKRRHFLNTFFKLFLTMGIILGSLVSIFFSVNYFSKSKNSNAEFGDTYNIRYQLDLTVNEENKNLSGNQTNSLQSSELRLKKSAEAFEAWLFSNGIYNDGVQYSIQTNNVTPITGTTTYTGWIFSSLYNIETVDFLQFKDVKQDPMRVLNNNSSNNFFEIIPYDKNILTMDDVRNNKVLFNSLGFNYDKPKLSKTIENSEDNTSLNIKGVEFETFDKLNIERFMNYKAGLNEPNDLPENYKWFVFNDLDKLIQRLNYVKSVSYWNNEKNHNEYNRIGQENLLPITLYDPSLYNKNTPPGVDNLNHIKFLYDSLTQEERTWGDNAAVNNADATVTITKENVLDFYNQFDSSSPSGATDKVTGNFHESIQPLVKKHIIEEITFENYHQWFPEAHELSKINEEDGGSTSKKIETKLAAPGTISGPTDINTFKFPVEAATTLPDFLFPDSLNKDTNALMTFFTKYSSSSPMVKFRNTSLIPNTTEPISFFGTANVTPPLIKGSITGLSAYESIFLATGIILLTIAIIVSIIYRVPGLIVSLSTIFTTTATIAFSGLLGLTFSFGSFLAIIIGAILTLSSCILFLERIRKNIIDSKSIFDSSMISIRKSIMTIVDIHFVTIIIGLAAALLGVFEMVDFGFELILTSLTSLLSTFAIFIFVQYNFSKSKYFWNSKLYFHKIENKIINKKENEAKFIKVLESPFK